MTLTMSAKGNLSYLNHRSSSCDNLSSNRMYSTVTLTVKTLNCMKGIRALEMND